MWKYAPQPLWYLPSVLHISLTLFKSIFINVYHNHSLFDKIFWNDLKFVVSITFPVNAFVVFHLSIKRHINKIVLCVALLVQNILSCLHKMSSGQNTMRTPTLQPVPESLPADHVSNSNKKKVRKINQNDIPSCA